MKKLMNWMNKPITWGGWLKYNGIGVIICGLYACITYLILFKPAWFGKVKKSVSRPFRKNE